MDYKGRQTLGYESLTILFELNKVLCTTRSSEIKD